MHPLHLHPVTPAHLPVLHALRGHAAALGVLRWHVHTPYARAIGAHDGQGPVGYACGWVQGPVAWLRELYVHPLRTGQGAGTALAHALLQELEALGARSTLLVAPEHTLPWWARLGFAPDGGVLHAWGGTHLEATHPAVEELAPRHWPAALRLHVEATGEERGTLLAEHAFLGRVYAEGDRVRGLLLPLLGAGLIVADAPEVGLELQRWLLPLQDGLYLPTGQLHAQAHLLRCRYTVEPAGLRLVRGAPVPQRIPMLYALPFV